MLPCASIATEVGLEKRAFSANPPSPSSLPAIAEIGAAWVPAAKASIVNHSRQVFLLIVISVPRAQFSDKHSNVDIVSLCALSLAEVF